MNENNSKTVYVVTYASVGTEYAQCENVKMIYTLKFLRCLITLMMQCNMCQKNYMSLLNMKVMKTIWNPQLKTNGR